MPAGRKYSAFLLVLICGLAVVAHAGVLFSMEKTWMTRASNAATWYPRLQFAGRWIAQGVVPMWDPFTNGGRPVAGDLQSGLWYLPNWALFLTAHPERGIPLSGYDLLFLFHLLLGAAGIYVALSRRWSLAVGFSAAVIWIALDAFRIWPKDYATTAGLAWLPWIVWSFRKGLDGVAHGPLAAASLFSALAFAAASFWVFGGAVLACCSLALIKAVRQRQSRPLLAFVVFVAWILSLTAIETVPAAAIAGHIRRLESAPFADTRAVWVVRERAKGHFMRPLDWQLPSPFDRLGDPKRVLPAGGAMSEHRFVGLTSGPTVLSAEMMPTHPEQQSARLLGIRLWLEPDARDQLRPLEEIKNTDVLPRLQVVYRARVGKITEAIDAESEALLDRPAEAALSSQQADWPAQLEIVSYKANSVLVHVDLPRDGIVVLNDLYFPGWKVKRDGKTAPLALANGMMRAVYCPAGKHTLRFRYRPWTFVAGATLSALALLGCLGLCVYEGRARFVAAAAVSLDWAQDRIERFGRRVVEPLARGWKALWDLAYSRRAIWLLPVLPVVYLAFAYAEVFRGGYFNSDDFNNLYWCSRKTFRDLIKYHLEPASDFFRPAGMFWYWALGNTFGLNPGPFHLVQGLLNVANAVILFFLVRRVGQSQLAAAIASGIWLVAPAMLETFWWFGTIFETVATTYFLLAIWVFVAADRPAWRTLGVLCLYALAVKAKEMAITLPVILFSYELIVRKSSRDFQRTGIINWRGVFRESLPVYLSTGLFGLYYLHAKFTTMASAEKGGAYYFDFTWTTLTDNMIWYLNVLVLKTAALGHAGTLMLIAALVALSFLLRDRLLIFAACFVWVTFLPVIFLANHHFDFYWYLPSAGACWWVGQLVRRICDYLTPEPTPGRRRLALTSFVVVFGLAVFQGGGHREDRIDWNYETAGAFRDYVQYMAFLPPPSPGTISEAHYVPRFFSHDSLRAFYRLIYGVEEIEVKIIDD